jgi:hypothetical protein
MILFTIVFFLYRKGFLYNLELNWILVEDKLCEIFVDYFGWLSLMSTLEEILVANSGSTKVWVMDPSLFDV